MWVRSLGQEDALEEEMATHSSILAWKIPWTEDPGGLPSMGSQRVGRDVVTKQQHTTLPPTATSPAAMEVTVLGKNPLPDQHTVPQCRRVWMRTSARVLRVSCIVRQCSDTDGLRGSMVAQMVKNLPAMQDTQVRSLG